MQKKILTVICSALILTSAGCNAAGQNKSTDTGSTSAADSSLTEISRDTSLVSETASTSESTDDVPTTNTSAEYEEKIFGKDVLEISITTEEANWQNLMDNAGDKPWIECDITIDGVTFKDVGIKT